MFVPIQQNCSSPTYDSSASGRYGPPLEIIYPPSQTSALIQINDRMNQRQNEWQREVDQLRQSFFARISPVFSPSAAAASSRPQSSLSSASSAFLSPSLSPSKGSSLSGDDFYAEFDLKGFRAEEISVGVEDGRLVVTAQHRELGANTRITRSFNRLVDIPKSVDPNAITFSLSPNNILIASSGQQVQIGQHLRPEESGPLKAGDHDNRRNLVGLRRNGNIENGYLEGRLAARTDCDRLRENRNCKNNNFENNASLATVVNHVTPVSKLRSSSPVFDDRFVSIISADHESPPPPPTRNFENRLNGNCAEYWERRDAATENELFESWQQTREHNGFASISSSNRPYVPSNGSVVRGNSVGVHSNGRIINGNGHIARGDGSLVESDEQIVLSDESGVNGNDINVLSNAAGAAHLRRNRFALSLSVGAGTRPDQLEIDASESHLVVRIKDAWPVAVETDGAATTSKAVEHMFHLPNDINPGLLVAQLTEDGVLTMEYDEKDSVD